MKPTQDQIDKSKVILQCMATIARQQHTKEAIYTILDALDSANNQLAALSTVCAKQKEALEHAEPCLYTNRDLSDSEVQGTYPALIAQRKALRHVQATIALTPADVADQIAQLQQQLEIKETALIHACEVRDHAVAIFEHWKKRAEAAEAKLAEAGKERDTAKALLADVKDRVQWDEDFSADEIVELISSNIGKLSIGPTWAMNAVHKEIETDMNDQLANLQAELKAAKEATQWQPIETAPKGKTVLLGYTNECGQWRTVRGQWFTAEHILENWDEDDWTPEEAADMEGWYETSVECDDVPNCWQVCPTHWMPLPPAPDAARGKEAQ